MENQDVNHINLFSIVRDVLWNCWMIAAAILIGGMLAYSAVQLTYVPEYTSSVTLAVSTKSSSDVYQNLNIASQMANVFAEVMDSDLLQTTVAKDMGVEELDATLSASVLNNTNLITLSATAKDSKTAFQTIQSVLNNYNSIFGELFTNASFETVQEPRVPVGASNPKYLGSKMKKAGLLCGGFTFLCIVVLSVLRNTLKSKQDVNRFLDAKCIASIPHEQLNKTIKAKIQRRNRNMLISNPAISFAFSESVQHLRARMETVHDLEGKKVFVFTSALENEGKSTMAANAALALAENGKRVLLIDADLRKPAQHRIWEIHENISESTTFVDYLKGDFDDYHQKICMIRKQDVLIMFNDKRYQDSTELLGSERMKKLLQQLSDSMDYIIIDVPPVNAVADAASVMLFADAAVMIVREDFCRIPDINRAIASLLTDDSKKLMGCVYNDAHGSPVQRYRHYQYGYGHYNYGTYRSGRRQKDLELQK